LGSFAPRCGRITEHTSNLRNDLADFTILNVDPGKAPPTVDLRLDRRTPVWSPKDDPDANKAKNLQGIYSLEGDTLKLFLGGDENVRPKAFPQKEKQGVMTLKRAKGQKGKEDMPAQARTIKPSRNLITGTIDGEAEEKLSPPNGFITRKEDFERLWKAWLLADKVPEVDFKTHLVVVATSREGPIKGAALIDEGEAGVMRIRVELERKSEGKALRVLIAVFPRAGIKTIEGRAITDK